MSGDNSAGTQNVMSYTKDQVIMLQNRKSVLTEEKHERSFGEPVIFRADPIMRDVKPDHFEGTAISLGLFNRCSWDSFKDSTADRNSLKIDVLIAFLADIGKGPENWQEISQKVVADPTAMKRRYDQRFCLNLPEEIIQSALALDAIFVACFLMCCFVQGSETFLKETETLLRRETENMFVTFYSDIFKIENQIPLLLLSNVISIMVQTQRGGPVDGYRIREGTDEGMRDEKEIFLSACKGAREAYLEEFSRNLARTHCVFKDCHHLLHSAARAFQDEAKTRTPIESQHEKPSCIPRKWRRSKTTGDRRMTRIWTLPTATELYKRGIRFEGQDDFLPMFEPGLAWHRGTLFLPKILSIYVQTEQWWRNLIAWEDAYEDLGDGTRSFSQYIWLMDQLVDNERDVLILTRGKNPVILQVDLVDNQKVADLFNSLTPPIHFYPIPEWESLVLGINDFHDYTMGRMVAEFLETYSNKPWLVVSVVAAAILLILTVLQTIFSIWSWRISYKP